MIGCHENGITLNLMLAKVVSQGIRDEVSEKKKGIKIGLFVCLFVCLNARLKARVFFYFLKSAIPYRVYLANKNR